jgi:hypothetical protein
VCSDDIMGGSTHPAPSRDEGSVEARAHTVHERVSSARMRQGHARAVSKRRMHGHRAPWQCLQPMGCAGRGNVHVHVTCTCCWGAAWQTAHTGARVPIDAPWKHRQLLSVRVQGMGSCVGRGGSAHACCTRWDGELRGQGWERAQTHPCKQHACARMHGSDPPLPASRAAHAHRRMHGLMCQPRTLVARAGDL